ncbi:hypothetical protein Ancab_028344, partial [Ancistrocladus abbreviatus]
KACPLLHTTQKHKNGQKVALSNFFILYTSSLVIVMHISLHCGSEVCSQEAGKWAEPDARAEPWWFRKLTEVSFQVGRDFGAPGGGGNKREADVSASPEVINGALSWSPSWQTQVGFAGLVVRRLSCCLLL